MIYSKDNKDKSVYNMHFDPSLIIDGLFQDEVSRKVRKIIGNVEFSKDAPHGNNIFGNFSLQGC